jgi:hypothetical protein
LRMKELLTPTFDGQDLRGDRHSHAERITSRQRATSENLHAFDDFHFPNHAQRVSFGVLRQALRSKAKGGPIVLNRMLVTQTAARKMAIGRT